MVEVLKMDFIVFEKVFVISINYDYLIMVEEEFYILDILYVD